MAEEVKKWLNQAIQIKNQYNRIKEVRHQEVRLLHARCRKSHGHIWMEILGPPMRYNGPPTCKKVCYCCGFYERVSEAVNTNDIKQALYTEVLLPPEKEVIRRDARELYSSENLEELRGLQQKFEETEKQVRKIRDLCNSFLGETSEPIIITIGDSEDYCFD